MLILNHFRPAITKKSITQLHMHKYIFYYQNNCIIVLVLYANILHNIYIFRTCFSFEYLRHF